MTHPKRNHSQRDCSQRSHLIVAVCCVACVLPLPAAESAEVDVVELTAQQIQAAYLMGDFTATDLVESFFARIDKYEPTYNAFISLNPNALATAMALDAEYALTGPRSPLHGVPVVIKDNIDQAGTVTTAGFAGFSSATGGIDLSPANDSTLVARLQDAGAIILGKTNLPDFAFSGTRTYSTVAGTTFNPYNLGKAPGGSSGGTATAVNASFAVLGLGTETGGSIENPASAQALVGVKPTFGLTPIDGVFPIDAIYRDVVGPMAKTVYDAAVTLDVLAGPTLNDLNTFAAVGNIPPAGYTAGLSDTSLQGKKFGLVGLGWRDTFLPLDPATEALYEEAIAVLESQGAEVVADPFLGSGFVEKYDERQGASGIIANSVQKYFNNADAGPEFESAETFNDASDIDLPGAFTDLPTEPTANPEADAYQAFRMELREIFTTVLETFDLDGLFFPQAGSPIPDQIIGANGPNDFPELPSNIINDLGVPVVTVPYAYYDDNTPMTLAFIGDLWTEAELLSYAFDFEQATLARVAPNLVPAPASAVPVLFAAVAMLGIRRRAA